MRVWVFNLVGDGLLASLVGIKCCGADAVADVAVAEVGGGGSWVVIAAMQGNLGGGGSVELKADAIGGGRNNFAAYGVGVAGWVADLIFNVVWKNLACDLISDVLSGVVGGDIAGFVVALAAAGGGGVVAEEGEIWPNGVEINLILKANEEKGEDKE